jgi:hypothetical protein
MIVYTVFRALPIILLWNWTKDPTLRMFLSSGLLMGRVARGMGDTVGEPADRHVGPLKGGNSQFSELMAMV